MHREAFTGRQTNHVTASPQMRRGGGLFGSSRRLIQPLDSSPLALLLIVVPGIALQLYLLSANWFYLDEYQMFDPERSLANQGLSALMRGHNGALAVVNVLWYRLIANVFGTSNYLPYSLPMVLGHWVLVVFLWKFAVDSRNSIWQNFAGLCLVCAFAFTGIGSENLAWAFQMILILPLVFGSSAIHLLSHRRHALAAVTLALSVASGPPGIVFVPVFFFIAAQLRLPKSMLASVAIGLLWSVWFRTYGAETGVGSPLGVYGTLQMAPRWLFGAMSQFVTMSGLVVLTSILITLRPSLSSFVETAAVRQSLVGVLYIFVAVRARAAQEPSVPSRHAYVIIFLILPLMIQSVQAAMPQSRHVRLLVCVTAVLVLGTNAKWYVGTLRNYARIEAPLRDKVEKSVVSGVLPQEPLSQTLAPGARGGALRFLIRQAR